MRNSKEKPADERGSSHVTQAGLKLEPTALKWLVI